MTDLTKPQARYLTKLMRCPSGLIPYGPEFRVAATLEARGLVVNTGHECTMAATNAGLFALRDYRLRLWGESGSMASQSDLEEVEKAIADEVLA